MKIIRTLIPTLILLVLLYGCALWEKTQPTEISPPSVEITDLTQERKEPVEEETDPVTGRQ